MEGLPYYQPTNSFGRIEVYDPAERSGGKNNKPLFLNKEAVRKMPLKNAYREVLQNLVDAVVEANGESFSGIKITKTLRHGNKVTCFHTDQHILGEIVEDPKKITFVNMGPIISNVNQIIQIGASEKHLKANQAGQHGEGLKRAALKFLTSGYRVEAFFAIEVDQQTEFRHLTFKLSDKHKCLAYSLSSVNPFERFKDSADEHRFELIIRSGDAIPEFNINDFMIDKPALIRGAVNDKDNGSVILDKECKGEVYIWHFFVCSYKRLYFGYDFFMNNITRDRDNINYDDLCKSIANVWSQAIVNPCNYMAMFFYTNYLMNWEIDDDIFIEDSALSMFSDAAFTLYAIYRRKNNDGLSFSPRPVDKDEYNYLISHRKYDMSYFICVP